MTKLLALVFLAIAPTRSLADTSSAKLQATPAALNLFERDWVLMNWALKFFDSNRDILLEPSEAQAAADAFRKIADANQDGGVSTEEYRAAREFILARY